MTKIPETPPSLSDMPFVSTILRRENNDEVRNMCMSYALNDNNPVQNRFYALIVSCMQDSSQMPALWASFRSSFGSMEAALKSLESIRAESDAARGLMGYMGPEQRMRYQREIRDIDYRWVGIHSIAISFFDNEIRKIMHLAQDLKPYCNFSMLTSRVHALYVKTASDLDQCVADNLRESFPYAHEILQEASFSPLATVEQYSIEAFADRFRVANLANRIAYQRAVCERPELCAAVDGFTRLAKKMVEYATSIDQRVQEIFDVTRTPRRGKRLNFLREWRDIQESIMRLRTDLRMKLQPVGEFATKSNEDYRLILRDILGTEGYRVTKMADFVDVEQYADIALAAIIIRLRSGQQLPLSWVRDIYLRLGGRQYWRQFIFACRTSNHFKKMPKDDILDARDFLKKLSLRHMRLKELRVVGSKVEAIINADEEDVLDRSPIGAIIRWRIHMLHDSFMLPEHEESDMDGIIRKAWLWCLRHNGERLPEDLITCIWFYSHSLREFRRQLKRLGSVGCKTRTYCNKLNTADLSAMTDRLTINQYRKYGANVPKEKEQAFLSMLSAVTAKHAI